MTRKTAGPRLTRWKGALALTITATALAASASAANAATFTPADGPALQAAITAANASPGLDTVILGRAVYQPTAPITITDDLVIDSDHSDQGVGEIPLIDGTFVLPFQSDLFTIQPDVDVTMVGFTVTGSSEQFAVIRNNGNLRFDSAALSGNAGTGISNEFGSTAVIINATIADQPVSPGVSTVPGSTTDIVNSTIANNGLGGLSNNAGSTLRVYNTIITNNDVAGFGVDDCFRPLTGSVTSLSGDGSCATSITSPGYQVEFVTVGNGGPTPVGPILAASPARNAGTNANCPRNDQRFFQRTDGQCDIGAFEFGGVRDTTPPTCSVTALRPGPPRQQDVTAQDSATGLGYQAIKDVTITNGTVAFSPFVPTAFESASPAPLVLTATKTDQSELTRWSFTALDWAGNVRDCR